MCLPDKAQGIFRSWERLKGLHLELLGLHEWCHAATGPPDQRAKQPRSAPSCSLAAGVQGGHAPGPQWHARRGLLQPQPACIPAAEMHCVSALSPSLVWEARWQNHAAFALITEEVSICTVAQMPKNFWTYLHTSLSRAGMAWKGAGRDWTRKPSDNGHRGHCA